ncbi:MAG: GAF domain-containing protein [Pseudomonadota bacterium]
MPPYFDGTSTLTTASLSESARLHTLHAFDRELLHQDQHLHQITTMAAQVCDTSIAFISLIDAEQQHMLAPVGLEAMVVEREYALCARAILSDDTMVVEDASLDPRYADNPLVTGETHVRFYAGAPLVMPNGYRIGTLCVVSVLPHQVSEQSLFQLGVLRDAVVTRLEFQRHQHNPELVKPMTTFCAWCQQVHTAEDGTDNWVPLDEYLRQQTRITHVMCPSCLATNRPE